MQWQLLVACDMVWVALTLLGGDGWREQPGAGDGISPSYRHWVGLDLGTECCKPPEGAFG